jgi:hypothetical protein
MRELSSGIVAKATALAVAVSCLPVLTACGPSELPEIAQARQEFERRKPDLERRQAIMAVEGVTANLDFIQGVGYQTWTAQRAAERLVALMNSAQVPMPGEPKVPGRKFTYVSDTVTGPWQVVIKAEGDALMVAAYGSNTAQPVEQRTIAVRRH